VKVGGSPTVKYEKVDMFLLYFQLYVAGYDHKLGLLLEKVVERLVNFSCDEKRFDVLKEGTHAQTPTYTTLLSSQSQHSSFLSLLAFLEKLGKGTTAEACQLVPWILAERETLDP